MSATAVRERVGPWIDGEMVLGAGGEAFDVVDPATGTAIAAVASAGIDDGCAAVDAASKALSDWAETAPRSRGEVLRRAYELMIEREDDLARCIVVENGKPLGEARAEIRYAAEFLRWFSEEAVRIPGELSTAPAGTNRILVSHAPMGVALLVTPWNFPAAMVTRKIAPALAAGCTTVLKPSEHTPLTALALAELLGDAGVPPGVVNVLPTVEPAPLVDALLQDERVRKLSFTGSTAVGRELLRLAARSIVSSSMELGGNAPFIVFGDVDLDAAVEGLLVAKMRNGGATCVAANRVYVDSSVADEFGRRAAAAMSALRIGNGLDDGVQVGPMIHAGEPSRLAGLVTSAQEEGGTVLTGGAPVDRSGYFMTPTVLDGVRGDATILAGEIFGPIVPICRFDDEAEAIALANGTDMGLAAYVYSGDLQRGLRVADALEAGMVGVNRGFISEPAAPFGGVKRSGLGREGGHHGLLEYLEPKYVAVEW